MGFEINEATRVNFQGALPRRSREFLGGISASSLALENAIAEIAPTTIPVLLVGESGTGKEMFAHHIHDLSPRSSETLRKIACASMNPEVLKAELGLHIGRSQNGSYPGTLLFDEICELDAACQRILLYALPDGDPGPNPGTVSARIISTTSKKLDEEVKAGRFRSELYYRLNGVCLRLPPLRERKEDIPMFAEFFLTKHAAQLGRPRPAISQRTLRILLDHGWPGNVRELENVVKNVVALGEEQLALSGFAVTSAAKSRPAATASQTGSLKVAARAASREAERELILKALARTRWNRKRAAEELQISYKSLLYKLKQIGLPESDAN
jgi:two-component system, NtrC family, response regulator AtoC